MTRAGLTESRLRDEAPSSRSGSHVPPAPTTCTRARAHMSDCAARAYMPLRLGVRWPCRTATKLRLPAESRAIGPDATAFASASPPCLPLYSLSLFLPLIIFVHSLPSLLPPASLNHCAAARSKDGGRPELLALYRDAPAGDFLGGRRLETSECPETYTWRNMLRGYCRCGPGPGGGIKRTRTRERRGDCEGVEREQS